jgi:hypothetical protein
MKLLTQPTSAVICDDSPSAPTPETEFQSTVQVIASSGLFAHTHTHIHACTKKLTLSHMRTYTHARTLIMHTHTHTHTYVYSPTCIHGHLVPFYWGCFSHMCVACTVVIMNQVVSMTQAQREQLDVQIQRLVQIIIELFLESYRIPTPEMTLVVHRVRFLHSAE